MCDWNVAALEQKTEKEMIHMCECVCEDFCKAMKQAAPQKQFDDCSLPCHREWRRPSMKHKPMFLIKF